MKFVMQSAEVPQMSTPQGRQLREQRQRIKKEHDTPKVEKQHPPTDGDIYEDQMDNNENPQNLQSQQ